MRKLCLPLILLCQQASALPIGNPADSALLCEGLIWSGETSDYCINWWAPKVGFYGDYVFNRHLESFDRTTLTTNAAFLALNLWNTVDVFGTLGTTNLLLKRGTTEIETSSDFSWSFGVRAAVWQCECLYLGIEGQYFHVSSPVQRETIDATTSIYDDTSFTYHEWQLGLACAYRFDALVPYVGAKWSQARGCFVQHLENAKAWGFAVGCSILGSNATSATVEARVGDEKAIYANVQVRF